MADIGERPSSEILTEKRRAVELLNLQCRIGQLELRKLELSETMAKIEQEIETAKLTLKEKGG